MHADLVVDDELQPRETHPGVRKLGELEREINSSNPKIDQNKQATADRLFRDKETREKARQKLDELERNAGNDELRKKKAQDMRAAAEQAAQKYDGEKPNADNVEQLSKQLGSGKDRDRRDAERRIQDWEKDPQAKQAFDLTKYAKPEPNITAWQDIRDILQNALTAVITQKMTAKAALDDAAKQANKLIDEKR